MKSCNQTVLFIVVWGLMLPGARGQRVPNWRGYKIADGFPESGCASVSLTPQGRVLVKHSTTAWLSELDGYQVVTTPFSGQPGSRIYESPGGQLWAAHSGGLQEFREGEWVMHPVADIARHFRSGRQGIDSKVQLCPVKQGVVIYLLPERLSEYNSEGVKEPAVEPIVASSQLQIGNFRALNMARDGGLWLAGERGLGKVAGPLRSLHSDSEWQRYLPPSDLSLTNFGEPHESADGGITVLAENAVNHHSVLAMLDGGRWRILETGSEEIHQAWRGPDGKVWAFSANGLLQWDPEGKDLVENEEVGARQYFDVAVEPGGTFWLATSDGLFRYGQMCWRLPAAAPTLNAPVNSLTIDSEARLWFFSGNAVHSLDKEQHREYSFRGPNARILQGARVMQPLKDGTLAFESNERIYQFDPVNASFRNLFPEDDATRFKLLGSFKDAALCIQRWTRQKLELKIERFDGESSQPVTTPLQEQKIGVEISGFLAEQNGDIWLSGDSGTAWYHDKKWRIFSSTDDSTPKAAFAFIDLPDGKLWCATLDRIWEFNGKSWLNVRRGFDRINAMVRARDGSIWVASNSGLQRFYQGVWVENGQEDGLPAATVRDLCEDQNGRLWAGTAHGLSGYFPDADTEPPSTRIQPVSEEKNIREGTALSLMFSGQDKWKQTSRARLMYSYRMDEQDWSPFSDGNNVTFPDLSAGKHYFQVRAMDRNCNVEPNPPKLDFVVILPWYKETRLVLISFAGVAAALFFGALAVNRHRQLVRSYAEVEKKVALRTRELEITSRELLHSQKMNALGTLAAGIAHDFNNILSIVKGSAQIIEDNLEDHAKVQVRVERIKTVVEQGAGIVKAMLGFSRESDLQPGLCNLNGAVEDTIKLLGDRFLREVQVRFEPAAELPEIVCSKDFIQQILLNFIFNAAEALGKRKQVILRTRLLQQLPDNLALAPANASAYVSISVQDFGCGIPIENLLRIFEPFFTTKAFSARRGTGLGLSMVYELAKKLEAGLAVHSVVEQGSTFEVILPVKSKTSNSTVAAKGHGFETKQRSIASSDS